MELQQKQKILHNLFALSIILKGLNGILELLTGLILLIFKSTLITTVIQKIMHHELLDDPTDKIAQLMIYLSTHISTNTVTFITLYLIIHGLINIGLFAGLWFKKLWAYPISAMIITILITFQIIRFTKTHSYLLLAITIGDIILLFLLYSEYKRIKRIHNHK